MNNTRYWCTKARRFATDAYFYYDAMRAMTLLYYDIAFFFLNFAEPGITTITDMPDSRLLHAKEALCCRRPFQYPP